MRNAGMNVQRHRNGRRQATVRVHVNTQYLLEEYAEAFLDADLLVQRMFFKYDPNHLLRGGLIRTDCHEIIVTTPKQGPVLPPHHLIIRGGIAEAERDTKVLSLQYGILIARYSIYYGNANEYSGNRPEECGYVLDVPKDPRTAIRLIHYDRFLDSLLARDARTIRAAVERFNEEEPDPVLVLPCLDAVLSAGDGWERTGLDYTGRWRNTN